MVRLSTLVLSSLFSVGILHAQTSDVVVFSEMGEKFTLIIDGDVKNEVPAARVVATGIRNETPLLVVRLADAAVPPVKQNAWMEFNKEYTLVLATNKKGAYVLRMQGMAELGTAKPTEAAKPVPSDFVEDGSTTQQTTAIQTVTGGGQNTATTTTVETTEDGGMGGENVNMRIDVNGVGVNMNVGVTDGMSGSTTSKTTTTTTHTTTHTTTLNDEPPVTRPAATTEPPVYHMPGYSGPVGCAMPMSDGEFTDAKASIESKGFEESKMTLAKQIGASHCFSVDQVKGVMGLFGFEDSKLDFAKFAYDHTHDLGNYYKVNDAFNFESSIESLNAYIKGR